MQTLTLNDDQKEVFGGMQAQFQGLRKQLLSCGAQLNLAERDRKRHDLTLHELESLPAGTNTYQSAGRMFLQTPCGEIIADLKAANDKCDSAMKTLGSQKATIEAKMKEQEQKINDFLQSVKGAGGEGLDSVKEDAEEDA